MKKLLRLILIFLVFALMAALSAITALACSPEDSNPEHHENIIQTDEEKPTCLRGGYYVLECTVCGMRCTYQTDPAMPHSFGPWEVVQGKEPTCTQSGTKRAYCSTCNKWYEMPAPPTDHYWVIDNRVFATCTTSGYTRFICDDCGTEGDTVTMSALGHKFGAWFTTTQPTCMANGIQKRECTRCGATETKSIAKTDHKFGAWFTTTQPTCMEKGIQTRECTKRITIGTPGKWSHNRQQAKRALCNGYAICAARYAQSQFPSSSRERLRLRAQHRLRRPRLHHAHPPQLRRRLRLHRRLRPRLHHTHPPQPRPRHRLMQLPRPRRVFRPRLHPAHQFRGQRIATERMEIGAKRADLVRTLSVKMFLKRTKRTMCRRQNAASPWEQSLYAHLCQRF